MFRHLLFSSKPICATGLARVSHIRLLSVHETASALRPFIFTVHPDLFGQFPKERAVNEESLKQLNEYIDQLHGKVKTKPVALTFYVRWPNTSQNGNGMFRPVRIRLSAQNLSEAVRVVLSSCGLPVDYVDNISLQKKHHPFNNASKENFANNTNFSPDQFSDMVFSRIKSRFEAYHAYDRSPIRMRRMARNTVSDWLQKNVDRARQSCVQMAPVRSDISTLKEMIISENGALDIEWQCDWTLPSFRTALRGLLRICRQHSSSINLKGRTVVFGNEAGVCLGGQVMLRHEDVADNWIVTLRSLCQHDVHLRKIPKAESYLSELLGNAEVGRCHHPVTMANDYLSHIAKLSDNIRSEHINGSKKILHSLEGVEVAILCSSGSLMISQSGQILIPSSSPAFLIIEFINRRAAEAKSIRQKYLESEKSYIEMVKQCHVALGVESLVKDPNVSLAQMESCCRRLFTLHESGILNVDLTLCHLKVAQFYSVMSDGDMCIPWNFED